MAHARYPRHRKQPFRLRLSGDSPVLQLLADGNANKCRYHELQCAGHRLRHLLQHIVLRFLGEEVLFWANRGDQQ